jgi:hypothetical protein
MAMKIEPIARAGDTLSSVSTTKKIASLFLSCTTRAQQMMPFNSRQIWNFGPDDPAGLPQEYHLIF